MRTMTASNAVTSISSQVIANCPLRVRAARSGKSSGWTSCPVFLPAAQSWSTYQLSVFPRIPIFIVVGQSADQFVQNSGTRVATFRLDIESERFGHEFRNFEPELERVPGMHVVEHNDGRTEEFRIQLIKVVVSFGEQVEE